MRLKVATAPILALYCYNTDASFPGMTAANNCDFLKVLLNTDTISLLCYPAYLCKKSKSGERL